MWRGLTSHHSMVGCQVFLALRSCGSGQSFLPAGSPDSHLFSERGCLAFRYYEHNGNDLAAPEGWTTRGVVTSWQTVRLLLFFCPTTCFEFVERVATLGETRVQWRISGRTRGLDATESTDSRATSDGAALRGLLSTTGHLKVHELRVQAGARGPPP